MATTTEHHHDNPQQPQPQPQQRVSVYVRVRPRTRSEELDPNIDDLPGLALTSNPAGVALETSTMCIDGFTRVFGPECHNRHLFEHCLSDHRLSTVLRGGTASLFCYGYTGGGKTFTAIGGGEDGGPEETTNQGLFFWAAEWLLNELTSISSVEQQKQRPEEERLFLRATACELYLDQVYDLIGPEKRPCQIRIDGEGQLAVHGQVTCHELHDIPAECRGGGNHGTLVTVAPGLNSISIHHVNDLKTLHQICRTQRACGTSTVNSTSSRSHAILRLEVVSTAMNRIKDTLQLRQAELPALTNAMEQCRVYREKRRIIDRIQSAEAEIIKLNQELETIQTQGPAALGGSILLVDLAGADYDHRGGAAQKESTAINQSLFALKECFRSIASLSTTTTTNEDSFAVYSKQKPPPRPPFRRSKLTRILEESLLPRETSRRKNKESVCVMVVNVSPASNLKHGTINALRYGQMFATSSSRSSNSSGGKLSDSYLSLSSGTPSTSRLAQIQKKVNQKFYQSSNEPTIDPEICKEEIREIYRNHVPEKTMEQVEEILHKFLGREQMLLEKVKAKYTIQIVG